MLRWCFPLILVDVFTQCKMNFFWGVIVCTKTYRYKCMKRGKTAKLSAVSDVCVVMCEIVLNGIIDGPYIHTDTVLSKAVL